MKHDRSNREWEISDGLYVIIDLRTVTTDIHREDHEIIDLEVDTHLSTAYGANSMAYARIACTGRDLHVSLTGWSITNGTLFDKCLFHEITIDKQFCPNRHVHRLILTGNDQLVFDNRIRWNRVVDRREWWTHVEIRLYADKGGVTVEVIDLKSTLITIENGDLHSPKSG